MCVCMCVMITTVTSQIPTGAANNDPNFLSGNERGVNGMAGYVTFGKEKLLLVCLDSSCNKTQ